MMNSKTGLILLALVGVLAILAALNLTSNTEDKVILDLTSSGGVLIRETEKRMLLLTSRERLTIII
ncbi:hypothetical protein DRO97_01275 [Archaeoglobales archaeon]|nr:MAG: hypothetical protein DRO97_01275 [Archaeoglobales archaeon]